MNNQNDRQGKCEFCDEKSIGISYQKFACKKHFEERSKTLGDGIEREPVVIKGPLPGQAVDRHLKRFGHLPTTELCDEKGSCTK